MEYDPRGGNLLDVVIVKSYVNLQAGSWLAAQEWTTNQKPGQLIDPTLDMTTTHKLPSQTVYLQLQFIPCMSRQQ